MFVLLPRIVWYFGGVVAMLRLRVSIHVVHLLSQTLDI
jgi:hypothetical protein